MSHFLERLVSSVTQPAATAQQPALRPLIGSIYAPAQVGGASRASHFEIETAESAVSRAGEDAAHGRSSHFTSREESASPRKARSSAENAAARSPEVLLPQVSSRAEQRSTESAATASVPATTARVEDRNSAQRENDAARRDLGAVIDLLMSPAHERAHSPAQSPMERPAGGKAGAANGETARRAPVHEADEITIHIGRIEVAAVQQQATRPAPAPARRAMSLDEYLKRGNGRAR